MRIKLKVTILVGLAALLIAGFSKVALAGAGPYPLSPQSPYPIIKVANLTRLDTSWQDSVNANIGDTLEFWVNVANIGNADETNVKVRIVNLVSSATQITPNVYLSSDNSRISPLTNATVNVPAGAGLFHSLGAVAVLHDGRNRTKPDPSQDDLFGNGLNIGTLMFQNNHRDDVLFTAVVQNLPAGPTSTPGPAASQITKIWITSSANGFDTNDHVSIDPYPGDNTNINYTLPSSQAGANQAIWVRFFNSQNQYQDLGPIYVTYAPTVVSTNTPPPSGPNLLSLDMQSGSITLPNLLTTGTLGAMTGTVNVPTGQQNVQWFGNTSSPASAGIYKLTGSNSSGSLQTDIYVPTAGANPNQFQSTAQNNTQFWINAGNAPSTNQYFAVIERADASASTTFSNVALYHSDQHVQWVGNAGATSPGTYTLSSGNVSGDGVVQVDVYKGGQFQRTVSGTFTIASDEYFAVIERAFSGTASYSNISLTKQ